MRARRAMAGTALAVALATGTMTVGAAAAAPATASAPAKAKQCPVSEIKKVWYGGTSTKCPNLSDQLDHLFYPGTQFTTKLKDTYREKVVFIQLRLFDLGYKPIGIDGKYGKQTKKVVKRYQRAEDLVVDGKVGKQTWKALFGLGEA